VSLNTRLSDRNFRRDGWRDRWDGHRHDRDRHWRDRHWYHDHWYLGFWPVYSPGYWTGYWWNRYPILSVFGITNWSVNRCGWSTGYYSYYNPYATPYVIDQSSYYYDYSQPIQVVESAPPDVTDETLGAFDRAMQEFYRGQYQLALDSVNEALRELPNDAAVHEFRALVLFASGRYEESAATLYAVLSVGPGWDWTTLNSLYPSVDIYTGQLRALEAYRNAHPMDTAPRFVLAYHYLTTGYPDAAASQLKRIVQLNPKDELSRTLLLSIDPDADVPKPEIAEPQKPAVRIQKAQLVGKWTAQREGDRYVMDLKENGDFTWTYTPANGDAQTVSGVWAVDEESVIALDMGEDDVMLAQLNLTGGELGFYMLGDTKGAEPLKFKK
jgi:tetratricopeptide (TPR) repeat protein